MRSIGGLGTKDKQPTLNQISFVFTQLSIKNLTKNRLVPPHLRLPSRLGNPGSATEKERNIL